QGSTLFPYTTLFRSSAAYWQAAIKARAGNMTCSLAQGRNGFEGFTGHEPRRKRCKKHPGGYQPRKCLDERGQRVFHWLQRCADHQQVNSALGGHRFIPQAELALIGLK